jgi:hypothetical protein
MYLERVTEIHHQKGMEQTLYTYTGWYVSLSHFSASISVGAEGEAQTSDDTESSAGTRRKSLRSSLPIRQSASGRSFRSSDPDGRLRF